MSWLTQFKITPPHIQKMLIDGYRQMSPQLALARIRTQYGSISEREQQLGLASLWLEPEIMRRVFQWDPDEKGY